MDRIAAVTEKLAGVPYMKEPQARLLQEIIGTLDSSDLLEVGFYQGKSTAYLAAILESIGRGHLTTMDHVSARKHDPDIHANLAMMGLSHRVTPIFAHRSYTWEFGKMLRQTPRPQFDFCYFDGGHTWDVTGFGFYLVDLLLKPGGWIVFDDLNWTIKGSTSKNAEKAAGQKKAFGTEEFEARGVRLVFETLVAERGYTDMREENGWGIARKPL